MSITRRPTVCQDFPVGIREVQASIDNNDGLLQSWGSKHAIDRLDFSQTNRLLTVGRHNDVLIARSVTDFYVDTSSGTPVLSASLAGPAIGDVIRLGTGSWSIGIIGMGQVFAAASLKVPDVTVGSAVLSTVMAYVYQTASLAQRIAVTTWRSSGYYFDRTDLDFSLAVWGTVAA
jgi:hypothetical protein